MSLIPSVLPVMNLRTQDSLRGVFLADKADSDLEMVCMLITEFPWHGVITLNGLVTRGLNALSSNAMLEAGDNTRNGAGGDVQGGLQISSRLEL